MSDIHQLPDHELWDALQGDPELLNTAERFRKAVQHESPDPHFVAQLRKELLLNARTPHITTHRKTSHLPVSLPFGLVAAAVILFALVVGLNIPIGRPTPVATILASSPINGSTTVAPSQKNITVSFNVPMNHASVVQGIHVEPAMAVTATWQGNSLVIQPSHPLAPNTPYVISIEPQALVTSSGAHASSPATIAFTTGSTSPASILPSPGTTPSVLSTTTLVSILPTAQYSIGVNDHVLVSGAAGTSSNSPSAQPSPSPSSSALGNPSPSSTVGTAVPSGSFLTPGVSGAPSPIAGSLIDVSLSGTSSPSVLAPQSLTAVRSPDGTTYAVLVPGANGTTSLELLSSSGGQPTKTPVQASAASFLDWTLTNGILYENGNVLMSYSPVSASITPLAILPSDATATCAPFRPLCAVVPSLATSPATPSTAPTGVITLHLGDLFNATTGSVRQLPAGSSVAFSDDGSHMIVLSHTSLSTALTSSPGVRTPLPVNIVGTPESTGNDLAISNSGTAIAYTTQTQAGYETVVATTSGTVLGSISGATGPLFNALGTKLVAQTSNILSQTAELISAPLPIVAEATWPVDPSALTLINDVISAQTGHGSPASYPALASIQQDPVIDSGMILQAQPVSATEIQANLRFTGLPSSSFPYGAVQFEQITILKAAGKWTLATAHATAVTGLSNGPHVLTEYPINANAIALVIDGDLVPSSVPAAVSLQENGKILPAVVSYDASAHTILVTAESPIPQGATVVVSTSLQDTNGSDFAAPLALKVS
ncbi:MAG: Ig-like domain-containing protein [Candidatus Dormibacteria bacterium]